MARSTEFRNAGSRFGSTIRQSLDLITGRNVNNYTLMFLDPTKQHKRGESKNIVVPYIVLGRNSSCHVQYGDEYPTVSRQHASIQSDDKGCTLIHNPQATNPTYVDGKPITGYHSLESGDEIQLSHDGPRIRFIIDRTQKTSTMGFTRRMSMAIGQSLRPYKRALFIAAALLIGIIGYSIWSTVKVSKLNKEQIVLTERISDAGEKLQMYYTTLDTINTQSKENKDLIKEIKSEIETVQKNRNDYLIDLRSNYQSSSSASKLLKHLEKYIYYIQVEDFRLGSELDLFDEADQILSRWGGTGFLAADGKFFTARHVVQPWFYFRDECGIMARINSYIADGGKISITYRATSSNNDSFLFTGDQIHSDSSIDKFEGPYPCGVEDDIQLSVSVPNGYSTDYAYIILNNKTSNIIYDRELSKKLDRGETLYVHGYPGGLHLQENYTLTPVFSEAKVAQSGIINNVLHVTSMSFVGGNSGGPVFAQRENKMIVIGLVSAGYDKIGVIVPTTNFR